MKNERKPFKELFEEQLRIRITDPTVNRGLTVLNADGERATIRIYDIIGWPFITADEIAAELDEITAPEIEVQIASIGGSVYEGIAIFNALRTHDARIITRVDSMAASVASVIAQAGDHRIMITASQMMIHEVWTITWGSAAELRKDADFLEKQTGIIAGIYAERSGRDKSEFLEMMSEETWFTDEETVEAGLADEVVKPAIQDDPEDRAITAPNARFVEQAESVVTDVEELVARAEKVIAFRSEQGKPPLSEDSVELFDRLDAAQTHLADVVTSAAAPEPEESSANPAQDEYLRFLKSTQGV